MLVVMPFCAADVDAAVRNLEWAIELDGKVKHDCLLSYDHTVDPSKVKAVASRYFSKLLKDLVYTRWSGQQEWPFPQNWSFQTTAKHIAIFVKRPFFWWEPDAVPLRAGFLNSIDSEWSKSKKPFMGYVWPGKRQMNGCACYPADVGRYSTKCLLCRAAPWDVVLSSEAIGHVHEANKLIVHSWDGESTLDQPQVTSMLSSGAVLYHRAKTSKLVEILRNSCVSDLARTAAQTVTDEQAKPQIRVATYAVPMPRWAVPVSIVMPVKDTNLFYLRDAWNSVLNQDHVAWNLIVVDDSSKPEVVAELNRMASCPRVQILKGRNAGLPSALNLGFSAAKTELVARMDSDDVMLPTRISTQVSEFMKDSRLDVLGSAIRVLGSSASVIRHPRSASVKYIVDRDQHWAVNHPSVMMRKSSWARMNGYDEELQEAEDLDLWLRMLSHGMRIDNLDMVLLEYRVHNGQKVRSENMGRATDAIVSKYRKRFTITFISNAPLGLGGAERWLVDLIRATSGIADWIVVAERDAHKFVVETLNPICNLQVRGDARAACAASNVVIFWIPAKKLSWYGAKCEKIVVSHSARYFYYEPYAKETEGIIPVAVHLAAVEPLEKEGFKNTVVIDNSVQEWYYSNPIVSRNVWRGQEGLSGFLVGYLGRFSDEKGIIELSQACRKLPPDVTVVVAGSKSAWETHKSKEIEEAVRGDNSRFHCIGWRNDVAEFLNACDCFILPSRYEGAAYCLLEAWLSKTPVVATPSGFALEHPDWLAAGITCDPEQIYLGILNAHKNPMQLRARAKIARQVADKCSWNGYREKWCNLLSKLAAKSRK